MKLKAFIDRNQSYSDIGAEFLSAFRPLRSAVFGVRLHCFSYCDYSLKLGCHVSWVI